MSVRERGLKLSHFDDGSVDRVAIQIAENTEDFSNTFDVLLPDGRRIAQIRLQLASGQSVVRIAVDRKIDMCQFMSITYGPARADRALKEQRGLGFVALEGLVQCVTGVFSGL